jgi:hypothetical protein
MRKHAVDRLRISESGHICKRARKPSLLLGGQSLNLHVARQDYQRKLTSRCVEFISGLSPLCQKLGHIVLVVVQLQPRCRQFS